MEGTMPIALVVVMGIVTVFIGLVCLILIMKLMSMITRALGKTETASPAAASVAVPAAAAVPGVPAANKQQLVAAIGAAIAEDMGTDVSHIRIHSIRKV